MRGYEAIPMKPLLFCALACGLVLAFAGCASTDPKAAAADDFKTNFAAADVNNDGKVTRQEFGYSMIENAFRRFDANKNGVVTLKEFVAMGGSPEKFKQIDRSGNGVITLEEAKSAKVAMDAMTINFYAADVDKDGYVTLGEALAYREKVREYTR